MIHKVVLVTGGFDPIHSGHISHFEQAKQLGDILIVGVNSDAWLERKKGQSFMNIDERMTITKNLCMVDSVIMFDDSDGSAKDAVRYCLDTYPDSEIIVANGGDRTELNIPEMQISCTKEESARLKFAFGIGGTHKMNSSSKILTEWKNKKTTRSWGYYRVLHSDGPSVKVKELTVEPGQSLSLQQHLFRSEYWFVTYGTATVKHGKDIENLQLSILNERDEFHIPAEEWHQLINNTMDEVRIVEIQYGSNCIEEDIIRI